MHTTIATPDPRAAVRPAATLVVARPAAGGGFELLLLRRCERGDQNSGAWVFPGGLVERDEAAARGFCTGLDDAVASARLGLAAGGLDFHLAAVRECFEEAGLLLAQEADGTTASCGPARELARQALRERGLGFAAFCEREQLRLPMDALAYVAHWVTPVGLPKRFDTRFFLALSPGGQVAAHDGVEVVDHAWMTPARILACGDELRLLRVTRAIVELVGGFPDTGALMRWAHSGREVPCMAARRCRDAHGARFIQRDHPAYEEIGLLDPGGSGEAWCELRPGEATGLWPGVERVAGEGQAPHRYRIVTEGAQGGLWIDFDAGGEPIASGAAGLEPVEVGDGQRAWLLRDAGLLFAGPSLATGASLPDGYRDLVRAIARGRGFLADPRSLP